MKWLAAGLLLILVSHAAAAEPTELIPTDAKLVISVHMAAIPPKVESPIREFVQSTSEAASFLGVPKVSGIDRIWVACGENYPRGTLVIARGKFDTGHLLLRFQELARERKKSAKLSKENDITFLSLETPSVLRAIPGVTDTTHLTVVAPDMVIAAFDKESLTTAVTRHANRTSSPSPTNTLVNRLDQAAHVAFAGIVPPVLGGPQGSLAGATGFEGNFRFNPSVEGKCSLAAADAASAQSLADRLKKGLSQTQTLFPAMTRTAVDQTTVAWLSALLKSATVDVQVDNVTVTIKSEKVSGS